MFWGVFGRIWVEKVAPFVHCYCVVGVVGTMAINPSCLCFSQLNLKCFGSIEDALVVFSDASYAHNHFFSPCVGAEAACCCCSFV